MSSESFLRYRSVSDPESSDTESGYTSTDTNDSTETVMPFRPSPCVAETAPHKRTEEFFNIAPQFREFCVPRPGATSRSLKRVSESYGKWEKYLPENSPYTHAVSPYFSNDRVGNNIVQCFPSWTNGAYVLQWASPVELEFLGFQKDGSYASSTFASKDEHCLERACSSTISDEDALCILMMRLGAIYLPWYDRENGGMENTTRYVSVSSLLSLSPCRRMIGWPYGAGEVGSHAWVLDLVPMASVGLGCSAIPIDDRFWKIQNATTMEERCEEIRRLGGKLISDV